MLDQIETESAVFYSGSYTDNIFIGSMLSGDRTKVASVVSGSNEIRYTKLYSTFLELSGTDRNKNLGSALRFRTFNSQNERLQDTILPDFYQAFLLNGGKPAVAYTEAGLSPIMLTEALPGLPSNYPVGKLVYTVFGTTASYNSGAVNVSDSTWIASFPFQGRYRSVPRMVNAQMYRTNIACPVTSAQPVSFNGSVQYGPNSTYGSSSLATIEVILPRITWQTGTPAGAAGNEPIRFTLFDVTGSVAPSGSVNDQFLALGAVSFPPTTVGFFGVGGGTIRPREPQLIKFAFGFGDNYQGVPILNGVSSSLLNNTIGVINGFYSSRVDIRGWKYGVINGFPQYTNCIFRSNRYGQLRDMLEQRKFTKFFDPDGFSADGKNNKKRGGLSAVLQITFVSGTNSAITASNPTTLNPNDSGIFDFEYKSGQPWQDV